MPTAAAAPMLPVLTAAAERYRLPRGLVYAVAEAESGFNPSAYRLEPAINDASYGLMQLLTSTARRLGFAGPTVELFDPYISAELGARLLRENLDTVVAAHPQLEASGEAVARAVAAYNAGWSKQRPADAPRDAAGNFTNAEYVAKVARLAREWELAPAIAGGAILGAAGLVVAAVVAFRSIVRQIERTGIE